MKRKARRKGRSLLRAFELLVLAPFVSFLRAVIPWAVIGVVFFFVFQGAKKYLFAAELFRLSTVVIKTDGLLEPAEIRALAGVSLGEPLLALDLNEIARRLEADRRVKKAVVERVLPSGLAIAVRERRAFMRLKLPDRKEIFVIDDEGGVLGEAREDLELPLFSDLRSEARGSAANGRYADREVRGAVFGIRRILEAEAPFRGLKVREIQVHARHNIHVQLENGLEIRVGKDYKEDLKKLRLVAPVMEGEVEELEYVDLRFRDVVAGKKEGKKRL